MAKDLSDLDALNEQLAAHRRTLAILLRQLAEQTPTYARPELFHGITFARAEIARLKDALRAQGAVVDDALGDVETPAEKVAAPRPGGAQIANADIAGIVDARGADFSGARGVQITGVQVGERTDRPKLDDKK